MSTRCTWAFMAGCREGYFQNVAKLSPLTSIVLFYRSTASSIWICADLQMPVSFPVRLWLSPCSSFYYYHWRGLSWKLI